jgi:hypothetical protein
VNSTALDRRIGSALTATVASTDLATLIAETETAIAAAVATASKTREAAMDPISTPDPNKARAAVESANFAVDRLKAALPRLRRRLVEVEAAERAAEWRKDFKKVEAERDAAAKKFARYRELVAEIVAVFSTAAEVDAECSRINGAAPPGENRRLLGVELTARDLNCFDRESPSIAKELRLPDWKRSAMTAWPPPRVPLAAQYAESMTPSRDPRYGSDWAAARKEDNARRSEVADRRVEEEAARQAESKRAYEESLSR